MSCSGDGVTRALRTTRFVLIRPAPVADGKLKSIGDYFARLVGYSPLAFAASVICYRTSTFTLSIGGPEVKRHPLLRLVIVLSCVISVADCTDPSPPRLAIPVVTTPPPPVDDTRALPAPTPLPRLLAPAVAALADALLSRMSSARPDGLVALEQAVRESGVAVNSGSANPHEIASPAPSHVYQWVDAGELVMTYHALRVDDRTPLAGVLTAIAGGLFGNPNDASSQAFARKWLLDTIVVDATPADQLRHHLLDAPEPVTGVRLTDALRTGGAYDLSALQTLLLISGVRSEALLIASRASAPPTPTTTGSGTASARHFAAAPVAYSAHPAAST